MADKEPIKVLGKTQSDLDTLLRWSHDAGLVINSNKTKLLVVKPPSQWQTITSALIAHPQRNCLPLEIDTSHTYLGLVIDSQFN